MTKANPFAPAMSAHRRKRKTTWYGVECGALLDEWTGHLALGSVTRDPEFGTITLRTSCRLCGAPGRALLGELLAIRRDQSLDGWARCRAIDAAIQRNGRTQSNPRGMP